MTEHTESAVGASTNGNSSADDGDYLDAVCGMDEVAITSEATDGPISRQSSIGITVPRKKSGLFGSSSNMVNSIVGAGIIGIPYAFKNSGLVAGVFLLALVAWLTDKSLRIIVDIAAFHPKLKGKVYTYEDLASFAFGRVGWGFILFNMFGLAYGAMVAYLLIIKDTVPLILGIPDEGFKHEIVMTITSLVVILPLSLQRDMASLAWTSLLSVTADVILVFFVAAVAPVNETVHEAGGFGEVLKEDWINGTLFIGLGILSTAMACQHSAFIVSGSLFHRTQGRWACVTCASISTSTFLCAVLGITGYLGYLEATEGDILNNFPEDSAQANGARGLLAITMFFTYPMEAFVARHVIMKLMFNGQMDDDKATGNYSGFAGYFRKKRFKWTFVLYVTTLIPALIVDDLGPVLSITGSLGGSCVAYIAPGLIYLGINGTEFLQWTSSLLKNHRNKGSSRATSAGDIELPVVGDAAAVMPESTDSSEPDLTGSKPWWWFVCGFPIWVGIASTGESTMRERLEQYDNDFQGIPSPSEGQASNIEGTIEEEMDKDVFTPVKKDYIMSMFFVVFGAVAAVAGLVSNIYVQVNDVFFTTT